MRMHISSFDIIIRHRDTVDDLTAVRGMAYVYTVKCTSQPPVPVLRRCQTTAIQSDGSPGISRRRTFPHFIQVEPEDEAAVAPCAAGSEDDAALLARYSTHAR